LRVGICCPVEGHSEVDLIPAQVNQFGRPEVTPVGQIMVASRRLPLAAAISRSTSAQMLAGAQVGVRTP